MPLEGGVSKASYTLDKDVLSTTIVVKDMSGNIVYTQNGEKTSGTHEFTWDGKDSNGNQLEDGAYQISVSTKVADGDSAASVTTTIFGKVTGVASDQNNIYVGLGDAVTAQLGDIVTIRYDDYFDKNNGSGSGENNGSEEGSDSSAEETQSYFSI